MMDATSKDLEAVASTGNPCKPSEQQSTLICRHSMCCRQFLAEERLGSTCAYQAPLQLDGILCAVDCGGEHLAAATRTKWLTVPQALVQ
jgi:hypothetical protein